MTTTDYSLLSWLATNKLTDTTLHYDIACPYRSNPVASSETVEESGEIVENVHTPAK